MFVFKTNILKDDGSNEFNPFAKFSMGLHPCITSHYTADLNSLQLEKKGIILTLPTYYHNNLQLPDSPLFPH